PASEAIFTVEPGPNAPVSSDTSICFGLAPTLFAQGTNVKWYSDSLLNNLVNSGNSFTTSDSSVGTYTYYLTDSISGCVSSITEITLEINSVATPPAVSDQTICQGENSPLFTAAGGNVRWYSDSTLKTLIQIGNSFKSQESDIGTYTYYLTDGLPGSCMSAKSNATLTILGKPSTPVVFDKAACFGGTVPAFTTSGSNISWYSDSSLVVLMGTGNSYAAGDTAVGSYDYFVIDSSNGCISDIASATVTIGSSLPSPNVTSETVCETSTIPALIASGSNVSWYDDAGLSSLVNTGNSFTSTKTESGTYTYFVTDSVSAGCVSSASSGVLTIVAVASAPVTSDTSSCYGETPPALIASGTNVTWFSDAELANRIHNGDTLNTGILDFGTYIYYVTDSNATCGQGPASTASLTINTNPLVTTNKLTITIGFGDSTELEAYNASTYEWFPSTGLSDTVGSLVMASPTADQVYAVIGTNKFGCSDSASITVFIDSTISINEATILSGLSIYPNPSLGRFTVEFYITGQHEPVDMCIMNGLGQILTQHELIPDNGEYKQVVNAEELAKGVYHLQLVTKKGTLNRLVVISK
ncbi:MAG: T9SS type A sorting domain-containing protein, partial [Bacteroidia bacterium]|nr:T9SS type A sorting domain-containing protein [Bacteroidia bacterium]